MKWDHEACEVATLTAHEALAEIWLEFTDDKHTGFVWHVHRAGNLVAFGRAASLADAESDAEYAMVTSHG